MTHPKHHIPKFEEWPLYWFARLTIAVEEGDHADAAKAHSELLRLGVEVRYSRRAIRTGHRTV